MPFDSIEDLRQSQLFERMQTLQRMTDAGLRTFIRAFNSVFDRVKRNGGSDDEAEATAIPIALSAAKRFARNAQVRPLEAESTFFVAHMPEQFGINTATGNVQIDHFDLGLIQDAPEVVEALVAGNVFTHNHQGEPVGIIKGIHVAGQVPQEIEGFVDPDAPFVFEGAFFEDVSEEVKSLNGVSAEWASMALPNGKDLLIPNTFVVTEQPLNGTFTGIGKVTAQAGLEGDDEVRQAVIRVAEMATRDAKGGNGNGQGDGIGSTMSSDTRTGDVTPEALQAELEEREAALAELREKHEETRAQLEEAQAGLTVLDRLREAMAEGEDKQAGLEGADVSETIENIVKKNASLSEENAELQERVASLEAERLEEKAASFCEENLKGKVPTEAWAEWKDLYKQNPEQATALASNLQASLLGEESNEATQLQEDEMSVLDASIDAALGLGGDE